MQENQNPDQYATYNGLNRPAMIMGVPLMLLLTLGIVGLFGTFIFIAVAGAKGFIFTGCIFLIAFGVKLLCDKDPNALKVIKMNLKGRLIYLKQGNSIIGFDSTGLRKWER